MSFRIHCPDCDIVFEPPVGVWSARCPFCGKVVEVPQVRHGDEPKGFRKRVRKGPGLLVRIRAHLPSWANAAMTASFVMILGSTLIQSWLAAHRLRSADRLERAWDAWNQALAAKRDEEIVTCADRLLSVLQVQEAKALADARGIDGSEIRSLRKAAAQGAWNRSFQAAVGNPSVEGLGEIKALVSKASADADLASFVDRSTDAWNCMRAELIAAGLARFDDALAANRGEAAFEVLRSIEDVMLEMLTDQSAVAGPADDMLRATQRLAERFGMTIRLRLVESTFSNENSVRDKVVPLFEDRVRPMGYVVGKMRHPELDRRFRDASKYLLEVKVSERFGRKFEDTPHRTTTLQFDFVLSGKGIEPQRRSAVVRSPRIPAKTALGMSRLQLSKNSDERVERTLDEAAWDAIDGPVTQAVGTLPRIP